MRRLDPTTHARQSRISEWELGRVIPDLRQLTVAIRVLGLGHAEEAYARALWEESQLNDLPVTTVR